MKVQVKGLDQDKPKFHPFVLEFKIESEQDLVDLWCRFNLNARDFEVNHHYQTSDKMEVSGDGDDEFAFIDRLFTTKPYIK